MPFTSNHGWISGVLLLCLGGGGGGAALVMDIDIFRDGESYHGS